MNRRVLKDLKVTKESVTATKAEYQITATADGQAHLWHRDAGEGRRRVENHGRSLGECAGRPVGSGDCRAKRNALDSCVAAYRVIE